jgi:hypothetical protein
VDIKKTLNKLMIVLKPKLNTLLKFISTFIAEILVISGAFYIVFATFKINIVAGYYCLGVILLLIGLFLANNKK